MESWALRQEKLGRQLDLAAGDTGESRSTLKSNSPLPFPANRGVQGQGHSQPEAPPEPRPPGSSCPCCNPSSICSSARGAQQSPRQAENDSHSNGATHANTQSTHRTHECAAPSMINPLAAAQHRLPLHGSGVGKGPRQQSRVKLSKSNSFVPGIERERGEMGD